MARVTRNCVVVFILLTATAITGFAGEHEREGRRRSYHYVRSGDIYYTGHVHYYSVPRYRCYPREREYYSDEYFEDYDHYVPRGRVHVDIVLNPFGYHDHYYYRHRHRHHHDEDEDDDD